MKFEKHQHLGNIIPMGKKFYLYFPHGSTIRHSLWEPASNPHLVWCDDSPHYSKDKPFHRKDNLLNHWNRKWLTWNVSTISWVSQIGNNSYCCRSVISYESKILDTWKPIQMNILLQGLQYTLATNLVVSLLCCNCCSNDLGTIYARVWTGLQLWSMSWRQIGSLFHFEFS
jgi:hypothetical protein